VTRGSRLRAVALGACLVTPLAGSSDDARADAWQTVGFESPAGKPAQGLVLTSVTEPKARLVVGCDGTSDAAWRGVAVWRDTAPASDADAVPVVVSFFGRAPVTESWQRRAASDGRVVVWPRASENLRRNLAREDTTRAQAAVTMEIRDHGAPPAKLVFGVDGFAERAAALAAACPGLAAATTKRRERGW